MQIRRTLIQIGVALVNILAELLDSPPLVVAWRCLDKYRERCIVGHLALGLHSGDTAGSGHSRATP